MSVLTGFTEYILLAALALGILVALIFAVIAAAKLGRQKDEDEFNPLAEYDGVDVFNLEERAEVPAVANSAEDESLKAKETSAEVTENTAIAEQTNKAAAATEAVNAVQAAKSEPEKTVAAETQKTAQKPVLAEFVPIAKRQGNWSNYDGEYEGYYYDPVDVCYYEGIAPENIQKMYLPAEPAPVVKNIKSPDAPLDDKPKAKRGAIAPAKPGEMDMAAIFGQYIIEHEGSEYFFTLYSNNGAVLYESFNYANEQYCRDAVKHFKKNVLAGTFSLKGDAGKFRFVLVRKLNTYFGPDKGTRADAEASINLLKYYAQTDVIKNQ